MQPLIVNTLELVEMVTHQSEKGRKFRVTRAIHCYRRAHTSSLVHLMQVLKDFGYGVFYKIMANASRVKIAGAFTNEIRQRNAAAVKMRVSS
jgi:hypothetical protein